MENQIPCFLAEVLEVHSGDDMIMLVSLGVDNLYKKVRVRLQGVDTPDAYKAGSDTEAGKIRDWVSKTLKGKECLVQVHSQGVGKGGWVCTLFIGTNSSTESLNRTLQEEGYIFKGNQHAA